MGFNKLAPGCCCGNPCVEERVYFFSQGWINDFDFIGATPPSDGTLLPGESFTRKTLLPADNFMVYVTFNPWGSSEAHEIEARLDDDSSHYRSNISSYKQPVLPIGSEPVWIQGRYPVDPALAPGNPYNNRFRYSADGGFTNDVWMVNRGRQQILGHQILGDLWNLVGSVGPTFDMTKLLTDGEVQTEIDNSAFGASTLTITNLDDVPVTITEVYFRTYHETLCPLAKPCPHIQDGNSLQLKGSVSFGTVTDIPDEPLFTAGCQASTAMHTRRKPFSNPSVYEDLYESSYNSIDSYDDPVTALIMETEAVPTDGEVSFTFHEPTGSEPGSALEIFLDESFDYDLDIGRLDISNIAPPQYDRKLTCTLEQGAGQTKQLRVIAEIKWFTLLDPGDQFEDWLQDERLHDPSPGSPFNPWSRPPDLSFYQPPSGGRTLDRYYGYPQRTTATGHKWYPTDHSFWQNLYYTRRGLKVEWIVTGLQIEKLSDIPPLALHSDQATITDLFDYDPGHSEEKVIAALAPTLAVETVTEDDGSMIFVPSVPSNPPSAEYAYVDAWDFHYRVRFSWNETLAIKSVLPVVVNLAPAT